MAQYPPIHIHLAVDRVDFNLGAINEGLQPRLYTPGEEISNQPDFLRGHGTYVDKDKTLRASVAGYLEKVNKLISIRPLKARYNGEIGDLVVGRVIEVQQKRWKIDVNAKLDAVLLLSSINLPGGELRRKSSEDAQTMRKYLQEGDLICAEVQSIFTDGSLSLHTRMLKYGKLSQGIMLKVPSMLIQRTKTHYHNLYNGTLLILGTNGYVWIGANIANVDKSEGGFTQDLSKIPMENHEICARLRNCVLILAQSNILLSDISITYAYEESSKYEVHELLQPETMLSVALSTHQRIMQSIM